MYLCPEFFFIGGEGGKTSKAQVLFFCSFVVLLFIIRGCLSAASYLIDDR